MKNIIFLFLILTFCFCAGCHNTKPDDWTTNTYEEDVVDFDTNKEDTEENTEEVIEEFSLSESKENTTNNEENNEEKILKNNPSRNILLVLPLSQTYEKAGSHIKDIIEKVNNELQEPFNLLLFDTKSNLKEQKENLYDFVINNDIEYIIGGINKEDTKEIVDVAKIKDIYVFSLNPDLDSDINYKKLFIQSITPENISYNVVKYAVEEKGFKKFAILYPYTKIGLEYLEYFKAYVNGMGGEVTMAVSFDPQSKNFDKPISKLVQRDNPFKRKDFYKLIKNIKNIKNPYWKKRYINRAKMKLKPIFDYDAIFLPIPSKLVNHIVPVLAAWDLPLQTNDPVLMEQVYHKYLDKNQKYVQVFGIPLWLNKEIFNANSPYINGLIFPSPYQPDINDSAIPFVALFEKELTSGKPLIYEALLYDLFNIIYYVFEKKERLENYEGIMGRYFFYKNHLFKDLNITIIDNQQFFSY